VEEFVPPYALDTDNQPAIESISGRTGDGDIVVATYGSQLEITWTSKAAGADLVNVTSVSLVAPSSSTHGFNFNQRVVLLEFEVTGTGTLTATLPPNANIAPPQMYLIFLLNGKTYSRSRWVHLQHSDDASPLSV
jgi:hypothetical protein